MLDDWPLPLSRRTALVRLDGVEVFYDFDWPSVIGHNRSTFRNGQALARLVTSECPEDLRPTLVLTCIEDAQSRTEVTSDRFILVVPIREYQTLSGADPAATFFARRARAPVTDLTRLAHLSPDELDELVDRHLDRDSLEAWLDRAQRNRRHLVHLLKSRPDLVDGLELEASSLPMRIRSLQGLDGEVVEAFLEHLGREGWPKVARDSALAAVVRTPGASQALGEALADRLPSRLQEVRADAAEYRQIIERREVTETEVQEFIEQRPWLVGLEYHRVRGRLPVLRGETDFVLDRFDGYYDILELKSPVDPIVTESSPPRRGQPPPASQHRLGPALSLALAQAHLYRHVLGSMSPESAEMYGLPYHRNPIVTILIGRAADLGEVGRHILTELNLSLSRVQIIPFDRLADRIEGIVANLEVLLTDSVQEAV